MVNKYTKKLVKENQHVYFIFGDNLVQKGHGGQAVIRDFKNTIGIPTKKYPSNYKKSFFNDEEYKENKSIIDKSFTKIEDKIKEGYYISLPKNGLGTGLAQLEKKAPKTNQYLLKKLEKLKKDFGVINYFF